MEKNPSLSSRTDQLNTDMLDDFFDQFESPKLLSIREIDMWDTSINREHGSAFKDNTSFDLNYLKSGTKEDESNECLLDQELEKSFFSQKNNKNESKGNYLTQGNKNEIESDKFSPISQVTKASLDKIYGNNKKRDEVFENIVKKNSKYFNMETKEPEKPKQLPGKAIRIRKTRKNGCNCKSSNCLRLHCACFKDLGYCKPTCRCYNCLNSEEYKSARDFVIEKIKYIYSDAFANHNHATVKDEEGKDVKVKLTGCNCKTGCSLNYCDCKKINSRCSYICKCLECMNDKLKLEKDDIQRFYKPKTRKKHKILINYDKQKDTGKALDEAIEFKAYSSARDTD